MITAERKPGVLEVITAEAKRQGAEVSRIEPRLLSRRQPRGSRGPLPIHPDIRGRLQRLVLALARQPPRTQRGYRSGGHHAFPRSSSSDEVVAQGFATTLVPGRLETLRTEGRPGLPVILDVAHNPDGMSALIYEPDRGVRFRPRRVRPGDPGR